MLFGGVFLKQTLVSILSCLRIEAYGAIWRQAGKLIVQDGAKLGKFAFTADWFVPQVALAVPGLVCLLAFLMLISEMKKTIRYDKINVYTPIGTRSRRIVKHI